ncbi:MAG TPA: PAS domain S-box protein, partial [Niastella sp.]
EKEVEKKVIDLKRRSEDLKISEERYHKMVEEVEDYAILMLDVNGIVQNWNKGAEKIKGYKEEDIVGKSFEEFYLPEDRENGLPLTLLELARRTGKAIHEGWRKRKDGTTFWGSIVLTALHDPENNLMGFSKVTRDLTERKLAEDKMHEYLSQLEFQNKELEQFVYAASHDMKEPLRKIHFYSDYIAGDEGNRLSPKSGDYLNRSIAAVDRMKKLIDDLLGYSRSTSNIESNKTVNLNEILDEVVHMHKEELERKNGKIEIEKLPVIKAVPFQIKQLMFNLINNAVKYKHPDRELQIVVKYELVNAGEIREYRRESASHFHKISVIDNGVGFDARYAHKIFEIFQRLNNASEATGSGIGLAICKKIAQNHRGYIQASGKADKGANFSIYLPSA